MAERRAHPREAAHCAGLQIKSCHAHSSMAVGKQLRIALCPKGPMQMLCSVTLVTTSHTHRQGDSKNVGFCGQPGRRAHRSTPVRLPWYGLFSYGLLSLCVSDLLSHDVLFLYVGPDDNYQSPHAPAHRRARADCCIKVVQPKCLDMEIEVAVSTPSSTGLLRALLADVLPQLSCHPAGQLHLAKRKE